VANSDQPLIATMVADLNAHEGRISAAVEAIVRSAQFRMIRGREYGKGLSRAKTQRREEEKKIAHKGAKIRRISIGVVSY